MLGWLPHLNAVFPEAVALAIRMLDQLTTEAQVYGHGIIKRLSESDSLVQGYPQEVAQLLIHLGKFDSPQLWYRGRELVDKLLQLGLPRKLEQELNELRAKQGL